MKYILDFFVLVGLCASIIGFGFWFGYASYEPKCHTIASVFTEHCK